MLALLLVAVSLGLSNFAAAIGIGVSGVDARTRVRVGVVFGIFEAGMPVAGLLLGRGLAGVIGSAARWVAAVLLAGTGGYAIWQARGGDQPQAGAADGPGIVRMVVTGLALSIDNLVVGFALGTYHVTLAVAAVVIGMVSAGMSLAGLEFGSRIGARAGQRGAMLGGLVLIAVGVLAAADVL